MKDRFDREINYLRISVTDRCNLRCLYCTPAERRVPLPRSEILSYEELVKIVASAVSLGITRIRITGGEPLVRKGLVDFIAALFRIKGISEVSMTTNGTLLAAHARGLARVGLKRVNISLDTLKEDRFRFITGTDALTEVLRGIDRALEEGLEPVKINVVVSRGINDDEIEDFVRLSQDRPLHVRFVELMPMGNDRFFDSDRFISMDEIKARCERIGPLIPFDGLMKNGPARCYRLEGSKGSIGFITPLSESFCRRCNRLRLTADGRLKPCLDSSRYIDVKSVLRAEKGEQALKDALMRSITNKPRRHHLRINPCRRIREPMVQIGG